MRDNLVKVCHWEITKRCNLSCIHCISSTGERRELKTKEALEVVDILKDFGCEELYLTGGEPFVRGDIFKILERAKRKKIKIGVITNGILINRENIKKIKLYVDEVGVSLDGASSEINDKIRGIGTFKKILEAIKIIKTHRINLSLYFTLNKINLRDIENFLKLATFLKVERVRITEISLRGRAIQYSNFLEIPSRVERNLEEQLIRILKKHFSDLSDCWERSCGIEETTIFLSPLGYIYPCVEIFQRNPDCHFGNIRFITLREFQEYQEVVRRFSVEKCPYEEIRGRGFSLCLNNTLIKDCPIEKKLCRLKRLTH